jgi:undecaprenyldiphospho-muramoylpentapeptide beta-N-acetylglucosaminyltransferase
VKLAIAAAGTGGHIYPALAVADELVARGHDRTDVTFIGGDRLERTAVPAAGFELLTVRIHGLRRSLSVDNLRLPWLVARAASSIAAEIRRRGIDAMLVMGGYVTVPAALGAARADVPYVVHEQNGRPGLANRLVARWAARVLVAFPSAASRLPGSVVVGNPLRRSLLEFDRAGRRDEARRRYGLAGDGPVLGVMGGSQGATAVNAAIAGYAARVDRPPIIHLVGPANAADMSEQAKGARIPWRVVGFEESMEDFYAASDLVVCRAGASTVSELAVTATPSILVPLEAVAQQDNAAYLVDAGAARLVPQADLAFLGDTIDEMIADRSSLDAMAAAARTAGRPEAATEVAKALEEVAGG